MAAKIERRRTIPQGIANSGPLSVGTLANRRGHATPIVTSIERAHGKVATSGLAPRESMAVTTSDPMKPPTLNKA